VAKGRRKYSPGPLKSIERLSSDEIDQIKSLAKLRTQHGIDLVADLEGHWLDVARARLNLADAHFQAAEKLVGIGVKGKIDERNRSVVSRAYYAMYSAARAVLAYGSYGDVDGHEKVAAKLNGASIGKQADRDRVVAALNKFRALRNEADYSPFYPAPLGKDAKLALAEGKAIVRICRGWVQSIAKGRGLKL
jgi:uncharacterized protein (UPF0332 family)